MLVVREERRGRNGKGTIKVFESLCALLEILAQCRVRPDLLQNQKRDCYIRDCSHLALALVLLGRP